MLPCFLLSSFNLPEATEGDIAQVEPGQSRSAPSALPRLDSSACLKK